MGTGGLLVALRNSSLVHIHWLPLLIGAFGTLYGTYSLDYNTQFAAKNLMYGGFIGCMSLTILPLAHVYASAILCDAAIATGVTMGALSTVAYNAPSE